VKVLKATIEKTIRTIGTSGASHHGSGVVQNSTGSKEVNYVLRCLGPVACRNPDMFIDTVKSCLKIQLPYVGDGREENGEKKTLEGALPQIVYSVKDRLVKMAYPGYTKILKKQFLIIKILTFSRNYENFIFFSVLGFSKPCLLFLRLVTKIKTILRKKIC